jgi:hypothetical protein
VQATLFETDDAAPECRPAPSRPGAVKRVAPPLREPFCEPPTLAPVTHPVRLTVAAELDAIALEYERGEANEDEVFRHLRGALFTLTPVELLRVGKGIAILLRETT